MKTETSPTRRDVERLKHWTRLLDHPAASPSELTIGTKVDVESARAFEKELYQAIRDKELREVLFPQYSFLKRYKVRPHILRSGLIEEITEWVNRDPTLALPAGELSKKYGVSRTLIERCANEYRAYRGVKEKPNHGGGLLHRNLQIKQIIARTIQQSGGKPVNALELAMEIGRRTQLAFSVQGVKKHLDAKGVPTTIEGFTHPRIKNSGPLGVKRTMAEFRKRHPKISIQRP